MSRNYGIPSAEYPNFYKGYIEKSGDSPVLESLVINFNQTLGYIRKVPKNLWDYRYEKGKWSVKELVLHLIDCERVFAYRAMWIARSSQADLISFDQDEFVANSQAENRTPNSLIDEFYTLRKATIVQFAQYDESTLKRTGVLGEDVISIRALGAIIVGHTEHHLEILKERYFNK